MATKTSDSISALTAIKPNDAILALKKCIDIQRPVFMWGPPGIGKSDIVKHIGNTEGRNVVDVRLSLWEPTDIKGIPYYNMEQKTMTWAPPSELPSDPASTDILFLDELNSAAPATQAAAYQLILNRRVGTYVLPKGVSIVAAGNREGDKGVTYRMPAPLANRFLHIELKADFDDWLMWATSNQIHEDVIGYLAAHKNELMTFDPKSAERSFATPRSWAFVSDVLGDGQTISEQTTRTLIDGAIGPGLGVKFMKHREIAGKLPDPESVLTGKVTDLEIKDISAQYSLIIGLCYELKLNVEKSMPKKTWDQQSDRFFEFLMRNFETELVIMAIKIAMASYKLPFDTSKMKSFEEFTRRYGALIKKAVSN